MGYLEDLLPIRRAQVERGLEAEREAMELADIETRQRLDHERERLALQLKCDDEKHKARMQRRQEKAELMRELEAAELEVLQAQEESAAEYHAIQMNQGGRATLDLLEREQRFAAAPPDNTAINALTDAVTRLIEMQSAPRTVVRDSSGRIMSVQIGSAPLPGTLSGGRDATK